ncbi:Voltage-dependent calcium channel type A subunit alpha-1 [Frankliniella fusca]|uniref:Voltage-dependent calcium channel type A subunit alpha-1 n=1 Tax=Frankliniella fusca TaxID=407009 RepID=A0AAE1H3K5_9NEOP|nr:Voltage-dependent calcium channel type A subunit alpha-1 [Frankliniella fusca]
MFEKEVGRGRRGRLRRQSTSVAGPRAPRSPESSSTCSSRDPSPSGGRHQLTRRSSAQMSGPSPPHAPAIRRQSTTEEILIARGFRRQSTTEEMIRCRNFRYGRYAMSTTPSPTTVPEEGLDMLGSDMELQIPGSPYRRQSSQSDDTGRYRGRRDSCAQITDGTLATMTIETGSTFFDSSTQTGEYNGCSAPRRSTSSGV